jgi:hypothetical protein
MHTEHLMEVMFGLEHVLSEFFWNAVFAVLVLTFSKARALRKIHKYIDNAHQLEHEKY